MGRLGPIATAERQHKHKKGGRGGEEVVEKAVRGGRRERWDTYHPFLQHHQMRRGTPTKKRTFATTALTMATVEPELSSC